MPAGSRERRFKHGRADHVHGTRRAARVCAQLPADIQWHFIGHIQSNKAKLLARACGRRVRKRSHRLLLTTPAVWAANASGLVLLEVPNIAVIETVSSAKLATMLDRAFSNRPSPVDVFVQVNTSGEASTRLSGLVAPPDKHGEGGDADGSVGCSTPATARWHQASLAWRRTTSCPWWSTSGRSARTWCSGAS